METENILKSQKLKNLAADAKSQETQTPFMEPGTKAKKGRPTKEEQAKRAQEEQAKKAGPQQGATAQPPPQMNIPSKEMAKLPLSILSARAVQVTGEKSAAMTSEELDGMSTICGMLLDKYMPLISAKYGLELAGILTLGAYTLRVNAIYRAKTEWMKKQDEARKAAQNGAAQTPPNPENNVKPLFEEPKPAPGH